MSENNDWVNKTKMFAKMHNLTYQSALKNPKNRLEHHNTQLPSHMQVPERRLERNMYHMNFPSTQTRAELAKKRHNSCK